MNKIKKILLWLLFIILISNIPIVSALFTVFLYSATGTTPFYYITKDLHFFSTGTPKKINSREDFLTYKKKYPKNDHTLYRCFNTRNWVCFFLWGKYLFDPVWQTPYLDLPDDLDFNRYAGHVLDDHPPYRWNDKSEKWERVK